MTNEGRQELEIKCNKITKYSYIESEDMCFVLYAWTDKKSLRDEFLRYRSDSFIMREQKFDDYDDFHQFEIRYKEDRLNLYTLKTYNHQLEKYEDVDVLMTFDENQLFTEYIFEYIGRLIESRCSTEYMYYNDKYIEALDAILYTVYHDIFHAIDESVEDYVSYNLSYGVTPQGKDVGKIYESIDQFKLFVYSFSEFFK